eukprot:CAMPEP_0119334050 /NCGR_PEP_ID=MMETSP1333-20130426/86557_1 /TAXON_ID=418940 /ORGANISM="Scyphosphaera apsteinii, Strain RCC1455" /LENGTH=213 /DNA_ID=CAMNT_0007344267 /DNA_START=3 /DNA_END=644 /DNA_ORIENTATION=-
MAKIFNNEYYAQDDVEFTHTDTYDQEIFSGDNLEQLAGSLRKQKDASVRKTTQQYMDEYYALDYEDLIGGDMPTRFKYRAVESTGYGVTDQELLEMDERSLSKRVPIRFIKRPYAQHDETKLKGHAKKQKWADLKEERAHLSKEERLAKKRKGAQNMRSPKPLKRKVTNHVPADVTMGPLESGGKSISRKKVSSDRLVAFSKLKKRRRKTARE